MWRGCRKAGALLLVKFHPRSQEYPGPWRSWAAAEGLPADSIFFFRDECTATEAVLLCTALITVHSTVVLDALVCRRPILLMQFLNIKELLPYAERYGIAVAVHSTLELAHAVTSIVVDTELRRRLLENFPRAIEHELQGLTGASADKTVHEIETLRQTRAFARQHALRGNTKTQVCLR
jgi:hypothetical protein